MRVRVKICGITSLDDAQAAIAAGADALGFMFYARSPRAVTPETAQEIIRRLPPLVARVGVFVDEDEAVIRRTAVDCGLTTVQFHGEEPPEFCARFFPLEVVKAFRVRNAEFLTTLPAYAEAAQAWLLDSFVPGRAGGTGERFNWDLAVSASKHRTPIILAGGLSPGNVATAIQQVRPYGVDVSSGVEASPGRKDPEKLRAFVQAVRDCA